jgi:hypothetical protein
MLTNLTALRLVVPRGAVSPHLARVVPTVAIVFRCWQPHIM